MKKRLASLLMALVMVVSVLPTAAFAAEEPKGEINYVSLGDSTTNGYGLSGYEFDKEDSDFKEWVAKITNDYPMYSGESTYENPNGLLMETPGAYPALFRDYLADKTGKDVNLIQLATSAMRADDVLTLLTWGTEDQYLLDEYSGNKDNSKYVIHNYSDVGAELPFEWKYRINEGDNEYGFNSAEMDSMGELYQKSVEAADVISINLGSNNFSIYLWGCLGPAIMGMLGMGDGSASYDPMLKELLSTVDDGLATEGMIIYEDVKATLMEKLADYIPKGSENSLEELCSNLADYATYTFVSYCVTYTRILERINELNSDADIILLPMVNFMKGFSVDIGEGELVDMSDLIGYMLDAANYYVAGMASVKDGMDYISNDVFYADHGGDVGMLMAELPVLAEKDFEGASVLRDRMISDMAEWMGLFSGNSIDLSGVNLNTIAAFPNNYSWETGLYLGLEKAIVAISQEPAVDIELFMSLMAKDPETGKSVFMTNMAEVFGTVNTKITALMQSGRTGDIPEEVETILMANPTSKGMLYVMAYFMIADGVVCHPSESGYETMYEAMVDAYETKHTAADQTKENLMEAVKFLLANYEEVYKIAYKIAEGQGYIAQANDILDEVEANIAAINVDSLGLSAELRSEVEALMAEILEDIEALRAIVNSPVHPAAEFYALMNELAEDLTALQKVAGQANEDLYAAVMALQAALEKALEEALKTADEEIRAAYEKVVEELTALAEQYGPEAEAFIREWLYENPKELLETILAYGEDIDAMLNHWNYHLGLILGPAWNAYGEELMAALEEVLALLGEEAAELSAQAAKELMAYIESLDLDTQIEEIADALMNGSAAIGGETLAELEEIAADLEKDLETNVKAVIDALETVAYGADSQAAKAEIEKVIELVKATEAELKGEIALIEQDIAALAALLEESYNGATDEIPDIAREIRKLLDDPMAVLELDGEDLAHVRAVLETLCETLKEIQTSAEAISKLTTDITNAAKTINTAILTMNGELKTAVDGIETTLTEAGADAETLLAETYEAIEAFVTTTADTVYTDASALMAVCELKLTAAVNELVAAIENVVSKAVSGSVKGDCTSVYTAIGDEVEGLAEALGLTAGELSEKTALVTVNFEGEELSAFVNAQIAGMIADTVEMNEDLVNILNGGYGATILAEIEKLGIDLKAETATLDWGKYLDEKAIGVKNETLAGIAQVLMDHEALMEVYTLDVGAIISPIISEKIGLDITVNCVANIPVAELAIAAIDNLLYAYVDTAAQCAAALEDVRAMAPEAEVVVLGLTDAAEELQVKIGNMTLDLAEYEEVLNAFVSAHYFAYALVNGENTTFVADAEAIAEALSVDVAGHVWNAYEKKDDETHYLVCSVCGAKGETEAHTLVDNKCVCGYEKVVEEEDRPSGGSSRPKHCPWCKTNTCHSAAFTDLDLDAWYHEYTDYVLCKGLMNGMGGTIFAPNATATRAMIITTLYRMEGSPAVTGEITFSDVAADTWYSNAVVWATQNGIVNGFADGTFAPMQNVTREQIAAIFFRLAELKGVKTDKAAELSPAYDDAGDVGAWAVKYMQWAVGEGLMKGRSTHMLVPAGETTRAETAALLQRWCEEIAD